MSLPVMALLLATTAASAQERTRSPEYKGGLAVESCYDWETGFAFTACERLPIPGQPGVIGQTYTLADGGRRTLTQDLRRTEAAADPVDVVGAAADSDSAAMVRAQEAASTSATRVAQPAPRNVPEIEEPGPAPAAEATGDDPQALDGEGEEPPKSALVEEQFVLPPVVATIPGRSEILPMATGHLNRIETPFDDPVVRTSAAGDALNVQFEQNFVYVSVTQPATLFIHQKDHPDPAIVVSLVPQRIAPRQVKLTVPPTVLAQVKKNASAVPASGGGDAVFRGPQANSKGVRREAAPTARRTGTVADLIQTFSKGRMPKGFVPMSRDGYDVARFCKAASVKFSFRQGAAIASSDYIILRGMAEASRKVELSEQWCANDPETLAVAFAPRTIIDRNSPADFYVLIRRPGARVKTAR